MNIIDTNYRDAETEPASRGNSTGKSTLDARVMSARFNDHFSQRDFSGTGGELRYGWSPTEKLRSASPPRAIFCRTPRMATSSKNSTFRADDTLSVLAFWQPTAKIAVQATLLRTLSDYRGPVFPITGPLRNDELRIAQLKADWAISRTVSLNASLEHDRRTSNNPGFEFADTLFTLGASLAF